MLRSQFVQITKYSLLNLLKMLGYCRSESNIRIIYKIVNKYVYFTAIKMTSYTLNETNYILK